LKGWYVAGNSKGAAVMFRLDYISCVLTIFAAVLLGQKRWQGWLVAAVNSILICDIALNTSQLGFIPANVFCIALYAYNIVDWRKQIKADSAREKCTPAYPARRQARSREAQSEVRREKALRRIDSQPSKLPHTQ
jgi:hypothetical protein